MASAARILTGLPPYGPMPSAFPRKWGALGREGIVVEFTSNEDAWVGNFQPGLGRLQFAGLHPNKIDAIVIAAGDLWTVNTRKRTAVCLLPCVEDMIEVRNPEGWIFNRQGIALTRLGPAGLIWHTRRLSWDGFGQLDIVQGEVRGVAWSPVDDKWWPFSVELNTGKSAGGSYFAHDIEGWEILSL